MGAVFSKRGDYRYSEHKRGQEDNVGPWQDDFRTKDEQWAKHSHEEVRHTGADERPEARTHYRHADGLSDQQRPDLSDQHALGAQRDVLPPALQQESEDEDRDRRGRHGQPISRVESEQAANVQRRET